MVDMQDVQPSKTTPPPRRFRTFLLTLVLVAIAFAAGYIPKELELRRTAATLKTTELDLRLANLHRQLGVAAQEAQRNNFANAATAARVFFDGCRALAQDEAFAAQPRTRTALEVYAGYADDILPRLANADPTVKEKLAGLYFAMDGVLARRI
jgi:hypothetical protein